MNDFHIRYKPRICIGCPSTLIEISSFPSNDPLPKEGTIIVCNQCGTVYRLKGEELDLDPLFASEIEGLNVEEKRKIREVRDLIESRKGKVAIAGSHG